MENERISVDERLPERGVDVLVYVGMPVAPSGEIDIAFLDDDEWIKRHYKGSVITHWMPMPEPPAQ